MLLFIYINEELLLIDDSLLTAVDDHQHATHDGTIDFATEAIKTEYQSRDDRRFSYVNPRYVAYKAIF
jgi:hypothetical protein